MTHPFHSDDVTARAIGERLTFPQPGLLALVPCDIPEVPPFDIRGYGKYPLPPVITERCPGCPPPPCPGFGDAS